MFEIERKFLLNGMPPIPQGAELWIIEQGYLGPAKDLPDEIENAMASDLPRVGRIRRVTHADGSITCTHTIKTGSGSVCREHERAITGDQFKQLWPQTIGRRLHKRRYRIRDSGRVWEIDQFDELDLALAEIELDSPHAQVTFPAWLAPYVVREVTEDAAYTNAAIASRIKRR